MPSRISPRLLAVGFLQNVASFLAWGILPLWAANQAGAEPWQQGMLPAVSGTTYILTALRAGRLSERLGRARLARAGFALFALFCLLAWWAASGPALVALGAVNGFAMALVWPGLQASIGDASTAENLDGNLGLFSLSWSAGKTLGFFAGAWAYGVYGLDALLPCAVLGLLLVPLLPGGAPALRPPGATLVDEGHHSPAVRAAHLQVGRLSNLAGYGLGSTLVYLYPKLLQSEGRDPSEHGLVLGTVFLAQTAGFWIFGRFSGWRYRFAPVAAWVAAGTVATLGMGLGLRLPWVLPAAALLGVASGQAYMASVYYAVHSESDRGARAGVHEAIIGAADFGVPLLGGFAIQATGRVEAAFVLAAAVAMIAIAASARAVRAAGSR